jgi:hypothetical protein
MFKSRGPKSDLPGAPESITKGDDEEAPETQREIISCLNKYKTSLHNHKKVQKC